MNYYHKVRFTICILFGSLILAQNEICLDIEPNPNINDPGFQCFTKYVKVLDCFEVYAQQNISDEKVLHVAAVAAELLDNNEDGVVDDEMLFIELQSQQALTGRLFFQTLKGLTWLKIHPF